MGQHFERKASWILVIAILLTLPARGGSESTGVDALFDHFNEGVQPGVAVMVIRDGEVVHSKGYGYANLEDRTPITENSTFRLGSVSKQFTALAVALLADRGQLDLDDPIARSYVPALAPYKGVTVRHLMTHMSGLPDYYDRIDLSEWEESGTIPSNRDVMEYVGELGKRDFRPGKKYVYSNPAYEALCLVVEAVSGQSFAEFMREEVFLPIGMDNSLIHDHHRPAIKRQVRGYAQTEGGYELDDWDTLNGITGSGSQFSTLEDFYAWDQALYGDSIFSDTLLEQAFTRARLNNGKEIDYGFGFRLDSYKGHRRIAHGGSWVGFNTAISRYPDLELTVVVLSNRSEYDPVAVSDKVTDIFLD